MITVITATYNRAKYLYRVYKSLLNQTSKEFEWIIVDDGSEDNTYQVVEELLDEKKIRIAYYKVPHGGKHRAVNFGVQRACGEGIITVDSDDFLMEDAIEYIIPRFMEILSNDRYAGISGLRCSYKDKDNCKQGLRFSGYVDATNLERKKYGLEGDKAEVYKTSIYKEFPYPEFEGEDFLAEGVMRNEVAEKGLLIRWYDHLLECTDYLKDGLTRNIVAKQYENPKGWAVNIVSRINCGDDIGRREAIHFFITMQGKLGKDDIIELLKLSPENLRSFECIKIKIVERFKEILGVDGDKSFALYGMGKNAQYFVEYCKLFGIKPRYAIDKMAENIVFQPTYYLQDELPPVDIIVFTPYGLKQQEVEDVKKIISKKILGVRFVTINEFWGNMSEGDVL